ncbi:MAG TPA: excinuclease ABC subunit UvrA [Candidatus Bathyarchaeia archaeon]|nr:excinuclease ABC subunit UvrA [Candidatus Bathyarchaeia archaeon]
MNKIIIKGAREHNLKNINLEIPKNKLVVFTGVSGSGKSSLAFDTLYAEGQRRYVESLSSYARQFLRVSSRPDVDLIEGLSPSIAIDQKSISTNPRSTVGTVTEIYDYLRLLFSRISHPHCPQCGKEITQQSIQEIVDQMEEVVKNEAKQKGVAKVYILSPVVKQKKGTFEKLFDTLIKQGYERARIDNYLMDINQKISLLKNNKHNIDVVIDRLIVSTTHLKDFKEIRARLYEASRQALAISDGFLVLSLVKDKSFSFSSQPEQWQDILFSENYACPRCNISLSQFQPSSFSFNSPLGACEECKGLGIKMSVDRSKVSEWRALSLESRYYNTNSDFIRSEIEKLMIKKPCPKCQGARLKKEFLSATVDKKNIYEVTLMSFEKLDLWLANLEKKLSSEKEKQISKAILKEIHLRLKFLLAVGLDYLDLARTAGSLSTGEGQRIRLASQIGTGLTGVLYILDEPTVGLHPRDNKRLIKTLERLRDIGNNPIIIEHDVEMMRAADWICDFGPLAGDKGGEIVSQGTLEQIKKDKNSLTGMYLSGLKNIPVFSKVEGEPESWLRITKCRQYNLKNINLEIPLNRLTCITGVSGSGKSTLIEETMYKVVKKILPQQAGFKSKFKAQFEEKPGEHDNVFGAENLARVLIVDQNPIGRTSRSNPATYTSVFTEIRDLFSQTREAKLKGFNKSYFSFNTKGGRCDACQGQGEVRIEMQFLPDLWVECEVCQGKRFIDEVLEITWNDKNIYEALQLRIEEALEFFKAIPRIVNKLKEMKAIGLEYLQLGQSSPTLSGGESQRLKLARELVKIPRGNTLYILDEPTVGLHFHDLKKLISILRQLVAKGNSVVVIEHNLDVIKNADWVIDLGPEGGDKGGYIVVQGRPEDIIKSEKSYTGKFLKKYI